MNISQVKTLDDLSVCLGVPKKTLCYYAYHAPNSSKYEKSELSKKGGGKRTIFAPKKKLKEIQSAVKEQLELFYQPRKAVHGYVSGKGIISNASVHLDQRWLGKIDLQQFFPSITTCRVTGLLKSEPFNLPTKVAALLALLSTCNNELPIGSPCSPIISNLISRRLDAKLNALSRHYKCYFSRYADDIFFSTNRKVFPREILFHNEDGLVQAGSDLAEIIEEEGFKLNLDKLSLKDKSQRQIVTGIVVNQRLNVPKEHLRELRAMLYSWEKFGRDKAEAHWLKNHASKNRFSDPHPRFSWVVRGKLEHIAAVRGKADPIYLKYAKKLAKLDDSFKIDAKALAQSIASDIQVYVEGKTDAVHVREALRHFHESGEYSSLKLSFPNEENANGDGELLKKCQHLCEVAQSRLTICLFDSDNQKVTTKMQGSAVAYKDHGNNVFSVVIPNPDFRKDVQICIEHLYRDADLLRTTSDGKRLFMREEFDKKNGLHCSIEGIFCLYPSKSTLIVDSDVIEMSKGENCALSKAKFADLVAKRDPPFDAVDFSGFKPLFDVLDRLRSDYAE